MQALLSISQAIAAVQERTDLLRVICEQIQSVLPFDDMGIAILNETGDQYYEFLTTVALPSEVNQRFSGLGYDTHWLPVDAPIDQGFAAQSPLILNVAQAARHYPDTLYLPVFRQVGIQQIITRSLWVRGQPVGLIYFNSRRINQYAEVDFPLFNSLADLVGVAVANILVNEEILEREREKEVLLSISGAITTVRDKHNLFDMIFGKLKPVFKFDNAVIALYDKSLEYTQHVYTDDKYTDNPHYQQIMTRPVPTQGNPHGEFITYREPRILSLNYLGDRYPQHVGVKIMEIVGLLECVIMPLRFGGELLATLEFHSQEENRFTSLQLPRFRIVADIIAVGVANILANEAIDRQLREITTLKKRIEAENVYLQEKVKSQHNFEEIVGASTALHDCLIKVGMVARTPSTVLIGGETGTGKELIARAIHNGSERRAKPLIKINCAALPRELIESELFGHERGAFTGAIEKRIGKFELANGSTLFLDEVGELPLEVQAKLLRAIQEREIERLGGNRVITVDVRIIVATNRDLGREVQAGRFRADLYFRLNVFPITLPPLRERQDDIPLLTAHFVQKSAKKVGKVLDGVSTKAMQSLLRYHFPGNIRELEHIIERGAILATGRTIQDLYLPTSLPAAAAPTGGEVLTLAGQERAYILTVLEQCGGRVSGPSGAARLLGLPASTLESKMKKLGIAKLHKATE